MDPRSRLLATLSALAISAGAGALSASAETSKTANELALFSKCEPLSAKAEVDCACNAALSENTVFALEAFVNRYRGDDNLSSTACAALAQVTVPPRDPRDPPIEAYP